MQAPIVAKAYDIVFCGGGSSACVVASRLAVVNPLLNILVLEAGPHTEGVEEHFIPGKLLTHLRSGSTTMSLHTATLSDHLDGRPFAILSGKCVGGGSNINFMVYTRASASDYNDWEKLGNPGWGYTDMLPLLKKMETYQIAGDLPTHGYSGPLKVSYGSGVSNLAYKFLEMSAAYDKERESSDSFDPNELSADSINKYTTWPKWIDAETGTRSTPASSVYELVGKSGLAVAAGCRVKRVVLQDGRAIGVEFVYDRDIYPDAKQDIHFVKATRLVVVSAGALGSPAILERSGIGSRRVLEASNIETIIDLPGVGECYQDHAYLPSSYLASDDAETFDDVFTGDIHAEAAHLENWKRNKQGTYAKNPIDVGIKYRPSESELRSIGLDFLPAWNNYFKPAPDKSVLWFGINVATQADRTSIFTPKFFDLGAHVMYPVSRGHVHIMSDDVYSSTDLDAAILKEPADIAVLRWAYKKAREFARRHPLYRGEVRASHPVFLKTSNGHSRQYVKPVPFDAPDIEWSEDDDQIIDRHIRKVVFSAGHSLGTCAMKPREQNGVTDPFLNVYGVQNLKVADMSIAPANVGANTNSTAMAIGEKAATIIAKELNLQL